MLLLRRLLRRLLPLVVAGALTAAAQAEPPSDHIWYLPARADLRFSGHCATFMRTRTPSAFMFLVITSEMRRSRSWD